MVPLPSAQIQQCYRDIGFVPPIEAMLLCWPEEASQTLLEWKLPCGDTFQASLPRRFGLRVWRQAENAYAVCLLWDSTYRQWFSLRRHEIVASSLGKVLQALGKSLDSLLDQAVEPGGVGWPGAA